MPLTAQHASAGVLDATVDPLGEGMPWEAIHRARPRAPLTCRECGHGLHAKVSPKGLRFFAHDRAAPTCSLVGEAMAHRLLKLQLASAIRDAGWYAELEAVAAALFVASFRQPSSPLSPTSTGRRPAARPVWIYSPWLSRGVWVPAVPRRSGGSSKCPAASRS